MLVSKQFLISKYNFCETLFFSKKTTTFSEKFKSMLEWLDVRLGAFLVVDDASSIRGAHHR